jgi:hypothetical protein
MVKATAQAKPHVAMKPTTKPKPVTHKQEKGPSPPINQGQITAAVTEYIKNANTNPPTSLSLSTSVQNHNRLPCESHKPSVPSPLVSKTAGAGTVKTKGEEQDTANIPNIRRMDNPMYDNRAVKVLRQMDNPVYESKEVKVLRQIANPVYDGKETLIREAQLRAKAHQDDTRIYDLPNSRNGRSATTSVHMYDSADNQMATQWDGHEYETLRMISPQTTKDTKEEVLLDHEYDSADITREGKPIEKVEDTCNVNCHKNGRTTQDSNNQHHEYDLPNTPDRGPPLKWDKSPAGYLEPISRHTNPAAKRATGKPKVAKKPTRVHMNSPTALETNTPQSQHYAVSMVTKVEDSPQSQSHTASMATKVEGSPQFQQHAATKAEGSPQSQQHAVSMATKAEGSPQSQHYAVAVLPKPDSFPQSQQHAVLAPEAQTITTGIALRSTDIKPLSQDKYCEAQGISQRQTASHVYATLESPNGIPPDQTPAHQSSVHKEGEMCSANHEYAILEAAVLTENGTLSSPHQARSYRT